MTLTVPDKPPHPGLDIALTLGIATVLLLFWNSVWLTPLKILIVFFHEGSHALATVLTGGEVMSLKLFPGQGGEVMSRGGSRFLILSAGYLGSLLIGAALLVLAARTQFDRTLSALLGISIAILTVLYARQVYAIVFGLIAGAAFVGIARFLSVHLNDLILRTIGLLSIGYVPLDIYSDTLARAQLMSDARMLAMEFGGTTQLWGLLWLVVSVVVAAVSLWMTLPKRRAQGVTISPPH